MNDRQWWSGPRWWYGDERKVTQTKGTWKWKVSLGFAVWVHMVEPSLGTGNEEEKWRRALGLGNGELCICSWGVCRRNCPSEVRFPVLELKERLALGLLCTFIQTQQHSRPLQRSFHDSRFILGSLAGESSLIWELVSLCLNCLWLYTWGLVSGKSCLSSEMFPYWFCHAWFPHWDIFCSFHAWHIPEPEEKGMSESFCNLQDDISLLLRN